MWNRIALNRTWMCAVLLMVFSVAAGAEDVADLVARMPAQDAAATQQLNDALLASGSEGIAVVCAMLVPLGTGDDTNARYALSGLAKYVTRPGGAAGRSVVAGVLVDALGKAADIELRTFLINQLQVIGHESSVPGLVALLSDEALCEPATQALLAMGQHPAVSPAFARALDTATGKNRVTVIQALGILRNYAAMETLVEDAASSDRDERRAALYAMANIGGSIPATILAQAAASNDPSDRAHATSCYLLYAKRLGEAGEAERCEAICRELLARTDEPNVQCAALTTLAEAKGDAALDDLLAAMDSDNKDLRMAALKLAANISGEAATVRWVEKLAGANPEARLDIMDMMGSRGDKTALPALVEALGNDDPAVRLAAIRSCAVLGKPEVAQTLLGTLKENDRADEIACVADVLSRFPSDSMAAVAMALPEVSPQAKVALLDVLARRHASEVSEAVFLQAASEDPAVRIAAMKALGDVADGTQLHRIVELLAAAQADDARDAAQKAIVSVAKQTEDSTQASAPVIAAMTGATPECRGYLLKALSGIGGEAALGVVLTDVRSGDEAVRDAAIRALADWPDLAATQPLIEIVESSTNRTHQVLALRGYVRLVGAAEIGPSLRVSMYQAALLAAPAPDDRKPVLAGLAAIRTVEALNAVAPSLDEEALRAEAVQAIVKITCPADGENKGLRGPEVAAVLKRAAQAATDEALRKQIEDHLASMQ